MAHVSSMHQSFRKKNLLVDFRLSEGPSVDGDPPSKEDGVQGSQGTRVRQDLGPRSIVGRVDAVLACSSLVDVSGDEDSTLVDLQLTLIPFAQRDRRHERSNASSPSQWRLQRLSMASPEADSRPCPTFSRRPPANQAQFLLGRS